MFGCNNDRLFSSLVLEIWSFTVYFSGKRRSLLHRNTAQGSFSPLQSYSKKTLRKNVPKSARNAHAPWASYNTPQIKLIQYGRCIGKKVYYGFFNVIQ